MNLEQNANSAALAANRPGWKTSEAILSYLTIVGAFGLLFAHPDDESIRSLAKQLLMLVSGGYIASRTVVKAVGDRAQAEIIAAKEDTIAESIASTAKVEAAEAEAEAMAARGRGPALHDEEHPIGGPLQDDDILDIQRIEQ